MRTYVSNCSQTAACLPKGYETTGILRYDKHSTHMPTSRPWSNINLACADEKYENLHPIVEWQVKAPANRRGKTPGEMLEVILNATGGEWPLGIFSLNLRTSNDFTPFRINYDEPTLLNIDNAEELPESYVIVPEDYTDKDWVGGNSKSM